MLNRLLIATLMLCAVPSFAEGADAGAPTPEMGPQTRKPTNEAKTKKEITDFVNAEAALLAAKNFDAMAERVDYPVTMGTDNAKGDAQFDAWPREKYVGDMKPFWESGSAGAWKMAHKLTITVLSDSLANVVDEWTLTEGKKVSKGKNASVVVKTPAGWKYKVLVEAGWGDPAK